MSTPVVASQCETVEEAPPVRSTDHIRVAITSDVRLYRETISLLLHQDPSCRVVGSYDSGDAFIRGADGLCCDVILVDMRMRDCRDVCAMVRLSASRARLVGFAVHETAEEVISCAELGLSAYVPCDGSVQQLVDAVRGAIDGRLACPPHIAAGLFERLRQLSAPLALSDGARRLTRREREIAALVAREFSNKEIAWELKLSTATVKNHLHNIMEKLGIHRRLDVRLHLRTAG